MQKKYTTEGQTDSGSVQCVLSINLQSRAQHMGTITSALFSPNPQIAKTAKRTPPNATEGTHTSAPL